MATIQYGSVLSGGERLRLLRERLGLTIRMVEAASGRIAAKYKNPDYLISLSRLSDIETKGIIPSIYRLYSLSVVYRQDIRELMEMFGVELGNTVSDIEMAEVPNSHFASAMGAIRDVEMPVQLDPGFTLDASSPMSRMIVKWGTVPLTFLKRFTDRRYNYGYVGTNDWMMYPLILPGSFVQIDETKRKVSEGSWRSELERPIFFVELRKGYACCWCELNGPMLILKPHPLSPARTRVVRNGVDGEVLGQVIGVAMRLDGWTGRMPGSEE